jgi:hypothetical protein
MDLEPFVSADSHIAAARGRTCNAGETHKECDAQKDLV